MQIAATKTARNCEDLIMHTCRTSTVNAGTCTVCLWSSTDTLLQAPSAFVLTYDIDRMLPLHHAIASFDSHYPGQKSSTQANTRVCFIELYTNTLGTDVGQCASRAASNSCSLRSVACRPAQRLSSAPAHVQLLSNVRHSRSAATACVSRSGAFTADQVSQENKDACMQSFCPRPG